MPPEPGAGAAGRRAAAFSRLGSDLGMRLRDRHPGLVISIDVTMSGDTHVIVGQVASEACRSDAKRLLLGMDGVLKVSNRLDVTGYLEAATGHEDDDAFFDRPETKAAPSFRLPTFDGQPDLLARMARLDASDPEARLADAGQGSPEEAEAVRRTPSAALDGEIVPGGTVELVVDLLPEAADHRGMFLGTFPGDWSEIPISVQISSTLLEVPEGADSTVLVRRDGSSTPARFQCVVSTRLPAGMAVQVDAYFLHGTRVCGHSSWSFPTGRGLEAAPSSGGEAIALEVSATSPIRIRPDASGPTLLVIINEGAHQEQLWNWKVTTFEGTRVGKATARLDGTAAEYAAALLATCPGLDRGAFRREMHGIGERIWNASPKEFQLELRACWTLEKAFPIQFVSADPHVPWELMKPDDAEADHLFLMHPIARWPLQGSSLMHSALPRGATVSFVPEYPDNKTLPAARDERDWLRAARQARTPEPTKARFLELLDCVQSGERVGILHFAGHGRARSPGKEAAICMADDWVTVNHVGQARVRLGERDHCLVILNACEVASDSPTLGINSGWAPTLAQRGFGGLVAPLWAVQDSIALEMVKGLLCALDDSATLGEGLLRARVANAEASVAALAYIAHGDVMARLEGS